MKERQSCVQDAAPAERQLQANATLHRNWPWAWSASVHPLRPLQIVTVKCTSPITHRRKGGYPGQDPAQGRLLGVVLQLAAFNLLVGLVQLPRGRDTRQQACIPFMMHFVAKYVGRLPCMQSSCYGRSLHWHE